MLTLTTKKIQAIVCEALSLTKNGVAVFDANDTVIYCNNSMAKLFGSTTQLVLNKTFSELIIQCFNSNKGLNIESDNLEEWLQIAKQKRRSVQFRSFEVNTQDGQWYLVTEQLVHGDILYFNSINITATKQTEIQLKILAEELHMWASTDELTVISNRRNFYEMAKIELVNAQHRQQSLTLLLIDIDNFKLINDSFGHATGDMVLKAFAQNIKTELRSGDIFGRLGGDEFAILLPNTDCNDSLPLAELFRNTIATMQIDHKEKRLQLTASIGIVQSSPSTQSIHDMMDAADTALYQAKSAGRNTVCSCSTMQYESIITRSMASCTY